MPRRVDGTSSRRHDVSDTAAFTHFEGGTAGTTGTPFARSAALLYEAKGAITVRGRQHESPPSRRPRGRRPGRRTRPPLRRRLPTPVLGLARVDPAGAGPGGHDPGALPRVVAFRGRPLG